MRNSRFYSILAASTMLVSAAWAQDLAKIQIGDGAHEFPESITSTADGTLYAGSVTKGVIYKVAPGAAAGEVFIQPAAQGPSAVLGVLADEANGSLWACYADMAAFSGAASTPSMLRRYDLSTGAEKASYAFEGTSFCNDITTTADGTAYAADTLGGRVVRTVEGSDTLQDWVVSDDLAGADGLAFGPDGMLYVNSVTTGKLLRVDVASDGAAGSVTELKLSAELKGPDGMRYGDDGVLYVAENAAGRVTSVTIDGDAATVTAISADIYDFPAAVTKVGDTLWVLESKLGKLGGTEDPGVFYIHPVSLN
jgi:sugar lactone lactonase YvrE